MTLISSTLLDRISSIKDLSQPGDILNDLDEFLQKSLSLTKTTNKLISDLMRSMLFFNEREFSGTLVLK